MRFLAVDADADARGFDVLEAMRELAVDRAFVLRAAALDLARAEVTRRLAADERFLDEVAAFVLSATPQEPPERHRDPPELGKVVFVVRPSVELPGHQAGGGPGAPVRTRTDRAVEMIGTSICMTVPDRAVLLASGEDLSNASFWIAGGAPAPLLDVVGDTPVVSPGTLDGEGGVLLLGVRGDQLEAAILDGERRELARTTFPFGARARLSVR